MAGIVQRLSEIREHYQYITSRYGYCYDSDIEFQEECEKLLESPSKKTAYAIYLGRIEHLFYTGFDDPNKGTLCSSTLSKLPVNDDKKLQCIAEKYLINI